MTKTISLSHFDAIVGDILLEKKEEAKRRKIDFNGVSEQELILALKNKIGTDWQLRKNPPRITDDDFKAMASGRFYKSGGIKYLGGWMILVLALLQAGVWLSFLQPGNYIVCGVATVVFILIYNKKQREAYREFKTDLWGDKDSEAKV